ncbi:MAG: 4'-phosphopantetheinyl transferase superfamily protein [Caulobacterales bacterium]|nr:4'-phosphopantetheinyl transferase superfamily protein [Caulobacterales bacterium]
MRIDVFVWALDPEQPAPEAALATLSQAERARMARFVFDKDRFRYGQSHARMRALLAGRLGVSPSDVALAESEHGKPSIPGGPQFNLSHSHNLAALAIGENVELGMDIEWVRPVEHDVARRFFSAPECAALEGLPEAERMAAFHRCWTRKEAYVKAEGSGLAIPLNAFDVTLDPHDVRFTRMDGDDHRAWQLRSFVPAPGYQGAVALRTAAEISLAVATSS